MLLAKISKIISNNPISKLYNLLTLLKNIKIYEYQGNKVIELPEDIVIKSNNLTIISQNNIVLQSNVYNKKKIHLNPIDSPKTSHDIHDDCNRYALDINTINNIIQ